MANIAKTAVELDAKTGQYQAKMTQAAKNTKTSMDAISKHISTIKNIEAMEFAGKIGTKLSDGFDYAKDKITNSIKAISDSINSRVDAIKGIAVMSKQTGMSTEFLSKLGFIAKRTGTSIDDIGNAFEQFSGVMGDRGFTGNVENAFMGTLQQLGQIPDYFTRANAAGEMFGEMWGKLNGLISLNQGQWAQLANDAERFGVVVSGATANSVTQSFMQWDNIMSRVDGVFYKLISASVPYMNIALQTAGEYIDYVVNSAGGLDAIMAKVPGYISSSVKAFDKLADAINSVMKLLEKLGRIGDISGFKSLGIDSSWTDIKDAVNVFAGKNEYGKEIVGAFANGLKGAAFGSGKLKTKASAVSFDAQQQAQKDYWANPVNVDKYKMFAQQAQYTQYPQQAMMDVMKIVNADISNLAKQYSKSTKSDKYLKPFTSVLSDRIGTFLSQQQAEKDYWANPKNVANYQISMQQAQYTQNPNQTMVMILEQVRSEIANLAIHLMSIRDNTKTPLAVAG